METTPQSQKPVHARWLEMQEVRLISDLRIMHSEVQTLFNTINMIRRHHSADDIEKYADHQMIVEDIEKMDQVYLYFVSLKEKLNHIAMKRPGPDLDSHLKT